MLKSSTVARRDIDDYLAGREPLAPTPGRRRLMDAVLAVAVEKGNAGISMRAIAKESNMQPASIYSHFQGGKDELLAATIQAAYIDFLTAVVSKTDATEEPLEQFRSVVVAHIDFQLESGWTDLWEVLIAADRAAGYLTEETRESDTTLRSLYRDYVSALVAEMGGVDDAEIKGQLVIELINRVSPEGALVRSIGLVPSLREVALGACVAIARSERAPIPARQATTAD